MIAEGLAGTGKTFIIQANCNTSIAIDGRNSADMASVPTGCAASIILGMTNWCSRDIPTGTALKIKPFSTTQKTVNQILTMRHSMSLCLYHTLDKHSMCNQPV